MKKMQQLERASLGKMGAFFVLGIGFGLLILIMVARLTWHNKFYPGVSIANIYVAGMTREQARERIVIATNKYQGNLTFNGTDWKVPENSSDYLIEDSLNEAYHYGRRLKIEDYLLLLINKKTTYPLKIAEGRTKKLESLISEVSTAVEIVPVEAEIKIVKQKVQIENGSDGLLIRGGDLDKQVRASQSMLDENPVTIPTEVAKRQLADEQLTQLKTKAESLLQKSLTLQLDDERIKLGEKELMAFIATYGEVGTINSQTIADYVSEISENLNKDPQDAKFEFENGKVQEFAPGKDGVKVVVATTTINMLTVIEKLASGESKAETVEITAERTAPKVTTEEVNKLGIKERIGRGESFYAHSIPNRIYNVALASSRINSVLIAPGEEVSFNKMVGEVSSETGYRPAYIIEKGRTVLGDGGGLCQVSTTMFRAAMSAGLPILERWGHAYRVSYYELNSKPGVDATVIAPSKDFKFKNDTPGHILIQTINDPKALHLVIEIYGTSDGRVATMSEPKVWGITPPLPTIYQDDPSLPTGTMKQVDWAASGARASFEYKVVRNGETIQDKTFSTVYRSWASVFLKGTGI